MSDDRKYYYMRLKEDFFESDAMQILESMPDGYLYANILLKLYLKSLKFKGKLMYNERIPYNPQVLATITRHQVGTIEKALQIFRDLDLIEILDNGAIYMLDIQSLIGKSSTEADRKKAYRERIEQEKTALIESMGQMSGQTAGQMSGQTDPEIKTYKDKEIKTYRNINNNEQNSEVKSTEKVDTEKEFERLWSLYPNKKGKENAKKSFLKAIRDGTSIENIEKGIMRYVEYIQRNKISKQYIKHGSTWFNQKCWQDDYDAEESENGKNRRDHEENHVPRFGEYI